MESNAVISSYEHYNEENRLTTNNARKLEFITTSRILNEHIPPKAKILDCAAGTGIYSFYLAEQGHNLTALDITPRHVEFMINQLQDKSYSMHIARNDARCLTQFDDGSFDVVLCMGPLYHLTEEKDRQQCLKECLRVLRKGGLLISAYINRFFVIHLVSTDNFRYLQKDFMEALRITGILKSDDPLCFWTDAYFHTPELMEDTYRALGLQIIDHAATDGISVLLGEKVDRMNPAEYEVWCDYHYATCREKSIIGLSNHGLIVGGK